MQPSAPDGPTGLIAFLLNNCSYSSGVAARCVLGLVDEGVLRAEPGPGGALTISLAAASPASGRALRPFEEVTLDRIRSRMTQRADVPLSVLLTDDGEDFDIWRGRLTDALGREGERMGLTTRASGKGAWYVQLGVTVVVGLIVLIAYLSSVHDGEIALGFGAIAVVATLASVIIGGGWRPTRGGAVAGALRQQGIFKMLPPDPRVNPLALMPPVIASGSGLADAPLPSTHAWSSFGGDWHPVLVRRLGSQAERGEMGPPSSPGRVAFTGEVVKRWTELFGPSDVETRSYLICIDDGSSEEGVTFDVAEACYKQLRTGDVAQATYNPQRGVRYIQKLAVGGSPRRTT